MLKFINQLIAGTIVLVGFVNMKVLKHIPFQVILKLDLKGCTRTVLLTKKYAFKIPTFKSYKLFISGIQANLEEKVWTTLGIKCINSSYYCNRFGFLVIQKRVRQVNHRGLFWVEQKRLRVLSEYPEIHKVDVKPENYGYNELNQLVKIDIG